MPLVSPATVVDVAPEVLARPAGRVRRHGVAGIGLPPSAAAVHDTVAGRYRRVAVTPVGASGAVGASGVTGFDGPEGAESPTPFVATTVNVYDVPSVNPLTVAEVAPEVDAGQAAGT